jgi:polar amino acid transport system substrate-binding protein
MADVSSDRKGVLRGRPGKVSVTRKHGVAVAAVAALAVVASACSSSSSDSTAGSGGAASSAASGSSSSAAPTTFDVGGVKVTADPTLAAKVPAAIRNTGVLNDLSYNNAPPDTAVVNGTLQGWEIDLGQAVAAELGLKWQATSSGAFDSFVPSLQNGRNDVSFTSFVETSERLQQIDFVTFKTIGTAFAVKAGSSLTIKKPTDLCGHVVSSLAGAAFNAQVTSIDCSGKSSITLDTFPSNAAGELAVSSGRADVWVVDEDQMSFLVAKNKQFVMQPLIYAQQNEGAGISRASGLAPVIGDAVNALIKSGAYNAIMKKWNTTSGLVTHAGVYTANG